MNLFIDAGNTRLKWAYCDGQTLQGSETLPIGDIAQWPQRLNKPVERAWVANVAGETVREIITRSLSAKNAKVTWISGCAAQCGVVNRYEDPTQLGADRWAALIATRALHPGAALVVCAGTATTVDMLDASGTFQGGVILPGYDLMRTALAQNTAQLPKADGRFVIEPRNTTDAIASGCMHAQVGAIERMFGQIAQATHPICMLSGGGATILAPLLSIPYRLVENLVLEGLVQIAASGDEDL